MEVIAGRLHRAEKAASKESAFDCRHRDRNLRLSANPLCRLGQPYCPACGLPIGTQTADEIIDKVLSLAEGTKLYLMAPLERRGQGKYETMWDEVRRSGFVRLRVDGKSYNVEEPPTIDHRRKHLVEVVVDRVIVRSNQRTRIADAVEAALDLGRGLMHVASVDDKKAEPDCRVDRF